MCIKKVMMVEGVNLNQDCSLAVLFSAKETGLLKWNDNKLSWKITRKVLHRET